MLIHCSLLVMLFVAPEILRQCQLSNHSFQKADVYSFAIVAQEILFRAGPFPLVQGVEITFRGQFLPLNNLLHFTYKIHVAFAINADPMTSTFASSLASVFCIQHRSRLEPILFSVSHPLCFFPPLYNFT